MNEILVANKYRVLMEIGSGGYGIVYETEVVNEKKQENVAMKTEEHDGGYCSLRQEFQALQTCRGIGIPYPKQYVEGPIEDSLIMPLLGKNLRKLLKN